MKLSIVIPAYNEEKRIGKTLDSYLTYFTKHYKKDYELIVVLNGCRDNTFGVVQSFSKHIQLKILEFKEAIGKGAAVIRGFNASHGDYIGFVDADLSTSAEEYHKLVLNIEPSDCIIASRYIKGAHVEPKQPLSRRIASRGFNILIRILFGLNVKDSQCGSKLFKKHALKTILPSIGTTRWAFDIDLLYQLKRKGFTYKESPTVWKDAAGSTLNIKKAIVEMFLAVIRLRLVYSPFIFIVKIYNKTIGRRKWVLLPHGSK
ncbi:MAG: dolichyl-phosphate beta-glucosyltransferase [Candidatus Nanoarchaeia archaeon]